jgi:hypothetical protein
MAFQQQTSERAVGGIDAVVSAVLAELHGAEVTTEHRRTLVERCRAAIAITPLPIAVSQLACGFAGRGERLLSGLWTERAGRR